MISKRTTIMILILIGILVIIFSSVRYIQKSRSGAFSTDLNESDKNATDGLIFHTGFENATIITISNTRDGITGIDPTLDAANDWSRLDDHTNIGNVFINYEDGTDAQRYARITQDPENHSNNVLMFRIVEPHIREGFRQKGRVDMYIRNNDGLREIYQKVKLYLHPDLRHLKTCEEKITWLTLFEFWNQDEIAGFDNDFRVTVSLEKISTGDVDEMYLSVHGDEADKLTGRWHQIWKEVNSEYSVPFGEWIGIESYIREGDSETGGFYLAVIDKSGKEIIFNLNTSTKHRNDDILNGFTAINPMKLYTSDRLIDFMENDSKKLEIYWDDWEIYNCKKP